MCFMIPNFRLNAEGLLFQKISKTVIILENEVKS